MADAARTAPEQFKEIFLPRLAGLAEVIWADAQDRDCVGHRMAVTAILEGLEVTHSTSALVEKFLERLGARDEGEAALLVARGRMSGEADLEQSCLRAIDLFRRRMATQPGYRRILLWELFGIREIEQERAALSPVPLESTNGGGYDTEHKNGNGSPS